MTSNKKILTGVVITALIILMLRKKIAIALNNTPFGAISDRLFNVISSLLPLQTGCCLAPVLTTQDAITQLLDREFTFGLLIEI